ncbi:glycosyltransferase family 39 protein [Halteromyces radiatus]|uniref:glycosyltransferase family 39 protein n=1 Tax=Halteromyces radiatus TaxID=101107 RepID=UPI00221FD9FC|nr:glycosyltransferase family 39 protein [Halteromyces radiatus]KAI8099175.1 glycosyltransferase family 39 protein [Halteromyces radiatus]
MFVTPCLQRKDIFFLLVLLALALIVRLYKIDQPNEVVFDEVHFGGFAGQYINGTYYFDVHPPLAKMLIALSSQISGYQGEFDFGLIGNSYTSNVPFVQMRTVSAILGALLAPISYITLRDGGHSIQASLVTAIAVCFENSLVTNSRLILLDPYLLFFTAWSLMSWNKFFKYSNRPFSSSWWIWLTMTGLGLGCTLSCKWVGLFIIATIGCSTINQLWGIWGNLNVTKMRFLRHVLARTICLIILPMILYIGSFYIHFYLLPFSGPGDSMMSSHFQHSLIGHEIDDSPIDIVYGSAITVRHLGTNGGYLHSHDAAYPEGSNQQQVTLYPYQDENNWWIIRKMNSTLDFEEKESGDLLGSDGRTWLDYVRHGDIVRLEHIKTSPRRLHSHDIKAPISDDESYKEVSGYGFPDYEGDSNDLWRLVIPAHDKSEGNDDKYGRLQTLRTTFQLIHPMQSCALYSGNKRLPDWGFGQQEVACIQNGKLPKTLWMVEETHHDLLPDNTTKVNYPHSSFWMKFKELHQRMWTANRDLTETHPYQSRPPDWPMLRRGVSFWARDQRHIYFLGNPALYWASTISIFTFLILFSFFKVRAHRQIKEKFNPLRQQYYEQAAGFYTMAWAFHYLPFYLMGRQLFLHHYLPALYCALLVFGVGFDCVLQKWSPSAPSSPVHRSSTSSTSQVMTTSTKTISAFRASLSRWSVASLWIMIIITIFYLYAPLSYGLSWNQASCQEAQWLPLWEFDCGRYTQGALSSSMSAVDSPTSFTMDSSELDSKLYPFVHTSYHGEL